MSTTAYRCVGMAFLLLLCHYASAETWVDSYRKARPRAQTACASGDLPACRKALLAVENLVGGRLDIEYRLARVEAELGLNHSALHRLEIYARSGLDLGDPAKEPAFAALGARGSLGRIVGLYRAGLRPRTEHERVAVLTDPELVAEDIVCGPGHGAFLLSSVRERKIIRVEASGKIDDFVTLTRPPLWGMFALAADLPHHLLWATTSSTNISSPIPSAGLDRSAVLAFELSSGTLTSRYELPGKAPHAFGDMTVSPQGDLYVSDGLGGGIYTIRAGRHASLKTWILPGHMASPQTPTLSRDGAKLLVPDYVRGIAIVNLYSRSVSWLEHPPELATFGIDGLYLDGRTLVAVQNGTAPERILLMHLTVDLSRVDQWSVLLARAPGLGDPTHGCLRDGDFYFIANSGWDQFDADGRRKLDPPATPPEIWKVHTRVFFGGAG